MNRMRGLAVSFTSSPLASSMDGRLAARTQTHNPFVFIQHVSQDRVEVVRATDGPQTLGIAADQGLALHVPSGSIQPAVTVAIVLAQRVVCIVAAVHLHTPTVSPCFMCASHAPLDRSHSVTLLL